MPTYTIQTPDGRKLKIQADTPEAAMAGAQQWHTENAKPAPQAMQPEYDQLGNPIGNQIPLDKPTPVGPGLDPQTRQPLPEGPFTVKGGYMSFTGGFNRRVGDIVSWPARLVEGIKNDISSGPPTNYVNEFMDRNYNSIFDPSKPQNGWDRGLRQGGSVLADTMAMLLGQAGLAGKFGRGAPAQAEDLAQGSQRAVQSAPEAFPTGAANTGASAAELSAAPAVPGMSVGAAAREAPQMLLDAAKAHPAVIGGLDAVSSVGSGMGQQFGEEHSQNPQVGGTLGSLIGGLLPSVYGTFISPAMWGAKGLRYATDQLKARLPAAADMEERQAARSAFANREGPYADPNVPAPKEPGMWSNGPWYEGNLPTPSSWVTKQRDEASGLRQQSADEKVGKQIREWTSHPDAQAASQRADELEAAIPGYKTGLAERFQIAPLTKKAEEVDQNLTGSALIQQRERKAANQKAIDEFADSRVGKVAPQEGPIPGMWKPADEAVHDNARDIVQGREVEAAGRAATAEQGLRDVASGLPNVSPQVTGQQIREGYRRGEAAADAVVERNKAAINQAADGTTFSGEGLNQGLQADMRRLGTDLLPEEITPPIGRVLGRTATPEAPRTGQEALLPRPAPEAPRFTANDLLEAQKEVAQQLRDLNSGRVTTTDGQKIVRLQALQDRLRAEERNLGPEGSPVRQRFDEFRRHYSEEVAPNYRQGLGQDILERDPSGYGGMKMPDSEIPDRLTNPSAKGSIEANQQNLRVNPPVEGQGPPTIGRRGTLDANLTDLRNFAYDRQNRTLSQDKVDEWLTKNANRLRDDPELQRLAQSTNREDLYGALRNAEADRRTNSDSDLNKLLVEGRGTARNIDEAMKDGQSMRRLKNAVGDDPDLNDALRRAVWERAIKDPGSLTEGNKAAINLVYGSNTSHLADLRAIADARAKEAVRKPAGGKAAADMSVGEFLKELTGTSIPSALSQGRAVAQGRQGAPYTAANVAVAAANKLNARELETAWREALTNPDLARIMAAGVKNGRITPMMEKKISSYILLAPNTQNKQPQGKDANEITVNPPKGKGVK